MIFNDIPRSTSIRILKISKRKNGDHDNKMGKGYEQEIIEQIKYFRNKNMFNLNGKTIIV